MKKIFGIILSAIGLNTLFSRDTESSFPPELKVGERQPITTINLRSYLPDFLNPRSAASGILNEIGKHESNGNYDVSFGNGKYGSARLTDMTLDEVREYQEVLLTNQRKAGIAVKNTSSAVGKYQFIRKTFDDTRNKLGLSGKTKFTPEIQDQFAYYQLKQSGWEEFIAGNLTIDDMMLKISKIWASFPKDFSGLSYYSNVANNKALVSPQKVALILTQAQET